jgi:mono/diheme cytochrome c family protein
VDTIGRQVTAFVTLFMVVALIVLMYGIFEPQRRVAAAQQQKDASIERGAELFAANCAICHGPEGKGIAGAGFPLNTAQNHNGDAKRQAYLQTTIENGKLNVTGKLPVMPMWAEKNNGPLNDQMVGDLVNFITYGNWTEVPAILVKNGTPVAALPTPPGLGTPIPSEVIAQYQNAGSAGGGGEASPPAGSDPGAALFQTKGCIACHTISPEYPNGGAVGPNLSNIASKGKIPDTNPTLPVTQDGLKTWIRDPQKIAPGTVMPSFGTDQISDQEMDDLTKWLLTHK